MTLIEIRSGGQRGADKGALLGARDLNFPTGGWAPKGWLTEDGPDPTLADFGLKEHEEEDYPPRTEENILTADGTLLIGRLNGVGTGLTLQLCIRYRKPFFVVDFPSTSTPFPNVPTALSALQDWIEKNGIQILNVAGNRESHNRGIEAFTRTLVASIIRAG